MLANNMLLLKIAYGLSLNPFILSHSAFTEFAINIAISGIFIDF